MFKKILVPVDGSKSSYFVLEQAIELFKDSEIIVLTVCDVKYQPPFRYYREIGLTDNILREYAKKITEEAEKIATERGIKIKTIIRKGKPVEEILTVAKEIGANVILMATHTEPTERFFFGSVTEGVLKKAPREIPILVWRGGKG
ncbi:MAG: universal stress protein [Candidatus Hydrothermarchaeota archaeon]